ncbi:hypothetical protein ACJQWK_07210 [Exserohilum turcicum]|uniref:Uncharacterized protein n=1 Tax=Exserohilum turcicum (strain 28A) TaxID=671987 RepID=R0IJX1_EXST2|nr:uncharacterized protein SETTUDRAFT_163856 [Exserohilum turcica Et28A]EOA85141.1 hypothetical protein SETTUDRAFT_163856 [Exserohilum turcica Et28A]
MVETPNKTGASGALWTEGEKIAYLVVLCENEGKMDSKIANAPIPAGRSIVSCRKLLMRLKEKHKDDIEKIKNGQSTTAAKAPASPEKARTPRKRNSKAVNGDADADADGGDGSPRKKRATPRKRKSTTPAAAEVLVKEEVVEDVAKEESADDESEIEV